MTQFYRINKPIGLLKVWPLLLLSLFSLFSFHVFAQPLPKKSAKICAIYPHLKDSYWLSINYGMVDEARKQNINLRVLEAGGYSNLKKQQQLLSLCARWQADAIILSTVTPNLYYDSLHQFVGDIPVFSLVNKLNVSPQNKTQVRGSVGVDWYDMGYSAGQYLAQKHPKGTPAVNIALLPGPKAKGGTKPSLNGFYAAIKDSAVHIAITLWADNDKELQRNLIQEALDSHQKKPLNYIVGNAVAIEAAISELRATHQQNDIGLVAMYFSHGVYRGLLRNKVEFSPNDKMVDQGRFSITQASHYLNHQPFDQKITPKILPMTPQTITPTLIKCSLSPSEYRPIFAVKSIE